MAKRRNAYNLGEKREPGAGGGQAGPQTGPKGPFPAVASGPLSADLHRWYCEPWCTKCGFVGPFRGGLDFENPDVGPEGCECGADIKLGLHTRPETQHPSLKWNDTWGWLIRQPFNERDAHDEPTKEPSWTEIDNAGAADLLVSGAENDAMNRGYGIHKHRLHDGTYTVKLAKDHQWSFAQAPTLPEAVALAMHRAKDAEEQRKPPPTIEEIHALGVTIERSHCDICGERDCVCDEPGGGDEEEMDEESKHGADWNFEHPLSTDDLKDAEGQTNG